MRYDYVSTAGPVCPYCEHVETPDEASYYRPELRDMECGECGETYEVEADHTTTWMTRQREARNAA